MTERNNRTRRCGAHELYDCPMCAVVDMHLRRRQAGPMTIHFMNGSVTPCGSHTGAQSNEIAQVTCLDCLRADDTEESRALLAMLEAKAAIVPPKTTKQEAAIADERDDKKQRAAVAEILANTLVSLDSLPKSLPKLRARQDVLEIAESLNRARRAQGDYD